MTKFPSSLVAIMMAVPLTLCAEDSEKTVNFGLDTHVTSKEFLPDSSDLGLSVSPFENAKSSSQDAFDVSETDRQTTKDQREYQQAVTAIEEERAAAQHRKEVAAQSQAFSKEFLSMNLYAREFPKRFTEILQKYPLAAEEEFCARLISKGRRIQAAAEAKLAMTKEGSPEKKDQVP